MNHLYILCDLMIQKMMYWINYRKCGEWIRWWIPNQKVFLGPWKDTLEQTSVPYVGQHFDPYLLENVRDPSLLKDKEDVFLLEVANWIGTGKSRTTIELENWYREQLGPEFAVKGIHMDFNVYGSVHELEKVHDHALPLRMLYTYAFDDWKDEKYGFNKNLVRKIDPSSVSVAKVLSYLQKRLKKDMGQDDKIVCLISIDEFQMCNDKPEVVKSFWRSVVSFTLTHRSEGVRFIPVIAGTDPESAAKCSMGSGGIGKTVSLQPLMLEDAVKLVRWMIPREFSEGLTESEQERLVDEISLLHGWPRGVTTFGETLVQEFNKSREFSRIVADAQAMVTWKMTNYESGLHRLATTTRHFLSLSHFGKKLGQEMSVEKMRQAGVLIGTKRKLVVNPAAAQLLNLPHQSTILNSKSDWKEFERFIAHLLAFKQNLLFETKNDIKCVSFRNFHHAAVLAGNVDLAGSTLKPQFSHILEVRKEWPQNPSHELREGKVILNANNAEFADVIAFHRCHDDTLIVDCVQAKRNTKKETTSKGAFKEELKKTDNQLNDRLTEDLKEQFGVSEVKYVLGIVSSGKLMEEEDMSKNENMKSVLDEIMEEEQPRMIDGIYAVDRERLVKWVGPPFGNRAQLFSYQNNIDLWNQCSPNKGSVEYAQVLGYKGESVEEMEELCRGLAEWKERNEDE